MEAAIYRLCFDRLWFWLLLCVVCWSLFVGGLAGLPILLAVPPILSHFIGEGSSSSAVVCRRVVPFLGHEITISIIVVSVIQMPPYCYITSYLQDTLYCGVPPSYAGFQLNCSTTATHSSCRSVQRRLQGGYRLELSTKGIPQYNVWFVVIALVGNKSLSQDQ